MAVYKEPYLDGQFILKKIQHVVDGEIKTDQKGNIAEDKNGNPILLPRPKIKGSFDQNAYYEIAILKIEDDSPIDKDRLADNIILLFNGVAPLKDKTDLEFRYREKGPQLLLTYRDPNKGGVTKNVVTISMLSPNSKLPDNFGQNLAATYDVSSKDFDRKIKPSRVPA